MHQKNFIVCDKIADVKGVNMFCQKCGAKNAQSAKFCKECGERLVVEKSSAPSKSVNTSHPEIGKRNIAACVVFSIITCGIYGLYWLYKLNEEVNAITGHEDDTSGGIVILFSIITCGIYGVYWAYKIGEKLKEYYTAKKSTDGNDLPILYLILWIANYFVAITTLIGYCLMQDRINKIVEGK